MKKTIRKIKGFLLIFSALSLTGMTIFILSGAVAAKNEELTKAKREAAAKAPEPVNVVTQRIVFKPMADRLRLPAVVRPWEDLVVAAEVAGTVVDVSVREGDSVAEGAPLVRIDPRDYENRLNAAEARHALAKADYDRLRTLTDKNVATQSRFESALAAFQEAQSALAEAKLLLERCVVRAPFSGTVNELMAKTGAYIAPGDPVARLLQLDRVKVEASIPEADVDAARRAEESRITIAALGNQVFMGRKIFLAAIPSSSAMVYPMRLALENKDESILPGMFAEVDLVKSRVEKGVGIPLYAVITVGDEKYVFVVRGGLAHKRKVTTGFWEGWQVQITDGLDEDEEVVIVGHRGLEDGQPLNVVKTVTDPGEISR